MTKEDKILLLKDLCSRLPYRVMVNVEGYDTEKLIGIENETITTKASPTSYSDKGEYPIDIVKPYLRPMSSMTEDERKEVENLIKENRPSPYGIINNKGIDNLLFSVSVTSGVLTNWLNAHHFDHRNLIERGLAIEVTEENNPYKD